ncbi:MAG: cytochrome c maturation protein CcmE [Woeseiaceae bacterium]|nr:cytochrome c maturation protein CcmE [Woeseiaceae bacterium]
MKARHQRLLAVGLVVAGLAIAATLTLRMFSENMMFFVEITDVKAGNFPEDRNFRIGGLIEEGSMQREDGSLDIMFSVTDMTCDLDVTYTGVLPDMVVEGKGIVAHGRMEGDIFVANKVLAKHDENYVSPEIAETMAQHAEAVATGAAERGPECPY